MEFDYDLFVIGAGSGGVRASRIAAGFGAKVAVAEEYRVGGTCVIRGCVPKKLMVYASHVSEEMHNAKGFGWSIEGASFDWPTLIAHKDREIDRLNGLYGKTLGGAGVEVKMGRATLAGPHEIHINGEMITAKTILIAVGGWPVLPDVPGIEHAITSNEALHLPRQPKRVAVVGAGYIALEFAGIFNGLGSDVHVIYRGEQVLRGFDADIREKLNAEMTKKGITLHPGTQGTGITKNADGSLTLSLSDGSSLEVDEVMYATGRAPKTDGLGLEQAGVAVAADGSIPVDQYSKTNVDHIYAVGDVTNRAQLTPVAIKEGHAFALTVFGNAPTSPEHDHIPTAVFTQPAIGTVGYSEEEALAAGHKIDVYEGDWRPMRFTLGDITERSYAKLIVDADTDRVLGAHMLGVDAPEIMQGIGIAVKAGLTKAQFDATVAIHPSQAEEFVLMRNKRG